MKLFASTHAVDLTAAPADGGVPEWIHVIPAGEFTGADGRGPFVLDDPEAVIRASLNGGKIAIDENHATDLAGSKGYGSPARGWITDLQSRDDGIWAKVDWTRAGRELVADRAYAFISPAFMSTADKPYRIKRLFRASLVNDPNLTMTSLHRKEEPMEEELRALLKLDDKTDKPALMAALKEELEAGTAAVAHLNAIGKALDLKDDAGGDKIVSSLNARLTEKPKAKGGEGEGEVEELREQVKQLNTKLTEAVTTSAKERATTAIDKAIEDGRLVPALRDHMISRHMKNPAEVEDELKLMPSLNSGGLGKRPQIEIEDGKLDEVDSEVCSLMGLDPEAFAKTATETRKEMM